MSLFTWCLIYVEPNILTTFISKIHTHTHIVDYTPKRSITITQCAHIDDSNQLHGLLLNYLNCKLIMAKYIHFVFTSSSSTTVWDMHVSFSSTIYCFSMQITRLIDWFFLCVLAATLRFFAKTQERYKISIFPQYSMFVHGFFLQQELYGFLSLSLSCCVFASFNMSVCACIEFYFIICNLSTRSIFTLDFVGFIGFWIIIAVRYKDWKIRTMCTDFISCVCIIFAVPSLALLHFWVIA